MPALALFQTTRFTAIVAAVAYGVTIENAKGTSAGDTINANPRISAARFIIALPKSFRRR